MFCVYSPSGPKPHGPQGRHLVLCYQTPSRLPRTHRAVTSILLPLCPLLGLSLIWSRDLTGQAVSSCLSRTPLSPCQFLARLITGHRCESHERASCWYSRWTYCLCYLSLSSPPFFPPQLYILVLYLILRLLPDTVRNCFDRVSAAAQLAANRYARSHLPLSSLDIVRYFSGSRRRGCIRSQQSLVQFSCISRALLVLDSGSARCGV